MRRRKPTYRLTAKQQQTLWRVKQAVQHGGEGDSGSDSESEDDDELDEAAKERRDEKEAKVQRYVLPFLLSLLDYYVKDQYYRSALVSATAALGVDSARGWKSPLVYTTSLSAIVTVAKMLVLYSAVQERKEEIAELTAGGAWTQEVAEETAVSYVERVQEMVDCFMTLTTHKGLPTPIDWVLRLRAFSKKIRSDVTLEGVVQWQGDTILYGYTQYSMPALRSMIYGLVETTQRALERDLLLLDVNERG